MDLNQFRDSFVNPIILKIINSGINRFDADKIAEIEFNKFSYSIFKTWSQFYSIDSVNYSLGDVQNFPKQAEDI
jgi:hypothetical protein